MKMDILDNLKTIKVCTGYKYKGKLVKEFPSDVEALQKARPVYIELPGWDSPAEKPRTYRDLPPNARDYLAFLKDSLGVRISMVSVGSSREETIFV